MAARADPRPSTRRRSQARRRGPPVPARVHPARDLRRHGLQRAQGAREDRASVRLRALGRGLDRIQRLPSAVRGPQPDAAREALADDGGAAVDAVGPQAGCGLLAGFADPQARRAHPRSEAVHRAQAVQRVVPDPRLHVAVLPAVRLARREREGARGQGRRDALGSLHRARHRDAQEAARDRASLPRGRAHRSGAVVLRPVRSRRRDDPRLEVHF